MTISSEPVERRPFSILGERGDVTISSVKEERVYEWYGACNLAKILNEASAALHENTDISFEHAKALLQDFVALVKSDHIADKTDSPVTVNPNPGFDERQLACWLAVRMTKPTNAFTDNPRWHRDGRMFEWENEKDAHYKYAMTVLGNPTLVLVESETTRTVLSPFDELSEEETIQRLAGEKKANIQPKDIIKFSWGKDDSPVHSEPDMSTDRVFVSILFASEKEMRSMCECREEKFRKD